MATYRADDENPKEAFVSHQAGLDGGGSSSYIDSVILRQKDANTAWTAQSDGTLEQRHYLCPNWRNDVSVVLTSAAVMVEWAKYTAYGIPIGLPGADADSTGACDSADITQVQAWIDAPAYDVRGDVDLDGDVDAADKTLAENTYQGTTLGWYNLSADAVANRIGYAGYHKDVNLDISHVRNRVLEPHLGRWTRRDPLGYVDGMSLYEYGINRPIVSLDPMGTIVGCGPRLVRCPKERDVNSPWCGYWGGSGVKVKGRRRGIFRWGHEWMYWYAADGFDDSFYLEGHTSIQFHATGRSPRESRADVYWGIDRIFNINAPSCDNPQIGYDPSIHNHIDSGSGPVSGAITRSCV